MHTFIHTYSNSNSHTRIPGQKCIPGHIFKSITLGCLPRRIFLLAILWYLFQYLLWHKSLIIYHSVLFLPFLCNLPLGLKIVSILSFWMSWDQFHFSHGMLYEFKRVSSVMYVARNILSVFKIKFLVLGHLDITTIFWPASVENILSRRFSSILTINFSYYWESENGSCRTSKENYT